MAVTFALTAFIFSDLVPDFPPFHRSVVRISITIWAGLLGFGLFPDFAQRLTGITIHWVNLFIARVTNEMMTQIMRLPHQNPMSLPAAHHAPVGGATAAHPIVLDTSAIIDGRILDIAKTGFISGVILIPSFILAELQQVADSADYLKRSRARRGFEIIDDLKKVKGLRIEVWDKDPSAKTVDDKVIKLAKSLGGKILTTDFNLNKVATLSGVSVLNVNDLANSLKTIAVPGEQLSIKVIHIGKDAKQGVGYLPDGTMIVIEDGADLVGKEVKAEVTRMLQVPAGRMIFTKKAEK